MCEVNTSCHKTVQVVLIHQPREWEEKQRIHDRYNGVEKINTPEKCILLTFHLQRKGSVGPIQEHFSPYKLYAVNRCHCGSSYLVESISHEKAMILFVKFLFVSIHFQKKW